MSLLWMIVIVLLVLALIGGVYGSWGGPAWGPYGWSPLIGLLLIVLLLYALGVLH